MYHRNTDNLYAYVQSGGEYDLDRFNVEYWQREFDYGDVDRSWLKSDSSNSGEENWVVVIRLETSK